MSTNRTSKTCTLCLMDKPHDAFHRAKRASGQRTPRQGSIVCGLHVAANLQILTSAANKKKSNHLFLAA